MRLVELAAWIIRPAIDEIDRQDDEHDRLSGERALALGLRGDEYIAYVRAARRRPGARA